MKTTTTLAMEALLYNGAPYFQPTPSTITGIRIQFREEKQSLGMWLTLETEIWTFQP